MTSANTFQKSLGLLTTPDEIAQVGNRKWNVLREDLSLPAALLVKSRLQHNLGWMAAFSQRYGVQLAPHGKTTMAPQLFRMQMEAGAWGITLATAHQCAVAQANGINRILMANELVGRVNCELISYVLASGTELYTLVDSADLVDQLGSFFAAKGQQLRVLLEIGTPGGRTGTRNAAQAAAVLERIAHWRNTILLCGLEVYEGVVKDESGVRAYLQHAADIARHLLQQNAFATGLKPLLTGAGSAWYDVVAEVFAPLRNAFQVLLRPGCYVTSDAGMYRRAQHDITQRNSTARKVDMQCGGTLLSAMEVWAYVQSTPEPGLAIVGLGKRDAAFDAGLPAPVRHFRPGSMQHPAVAAADWTTSKLMDQHLYLATAVDADLRVGDMLAFEISHPCLTFDKWRYVTLVDDDYHVLDALPTFF